MHTAVRDQTNPKKLFITQPWAIAFKLSANEGYVVSAASNIVVKVASERGDGSAGGAVRSVGSHARAADPGRQESARNRGELDATRART